MINYLFFLIVGFVTLDFAFGSYFAWRNRRAAKPQLPDELIGIYDAKEYARQQDYFRVNNAFSNVTRSFEYVLMMAMLFIGGFGLIDNLAYQVMPSPALAVLFFFGVIYIGNDILTMPFAYYSTFVIEERFGFNKMTPKLFFGDILKGWLISALLGGVLILSVFLLFQRWNEMFWLYAWGLICVVTVFFTMFYSEWIVPLFNKQTPLAPGVLREAIEQFARKNDFAVSDIYVIDGSKRTTKANAYFTGLGRKKRIVLYDTLLKELTTEEIVAVLAHEIGHYKHRHVYISLLFSLLNSFLLLYVFSLLVDSEVLAHAMGGESPTFELGLIAFTLLYSPFGLVIGILFNIFLRRNEYQADYYAAEHGLAEPLVSGLKKISVKALSNMTPDSWYVFVYYSHPTLLQRIARLQPFIASEEQNSKKII